MFGRTKALPTTSHGSMPLQEAAARDAIEIVAADPLFPVLHTVVQAARPVLDAVRAGGAEQAEPETVEGPGRNIARRAGAAIRGATLPGSAEWNGMDGTARTEWWASRLGTVLAVALSSASAAGPVAERTGLRASLTATGRSLLLCAVGQENGVHDSDEQVRCSPR